MLYRQRVNNENLTKRVYQRKVGPFDIPYIGVESIDLEDLDKTEFISFNYAMTERHPENKGVHFYLDDYQFQRVWNNIDKYIPLLQQFKYVLSPDFSTYTDWPVAINVYNHYRKHWCGAYMQEAGIRVIPSVSWARDDDGSYAFQFDGEPVYGLLSVCSVGCCTNTTTMENFKKGFDAMYERLKPAAVLFFGNQIIDPKQYDCKFIFKETAQVMRFKSLGRGAR